MKLKDISNKVTSKIGRQILHGRKHTPAALFVVGVVGVVGTVILASRATLKLEEVIEKAQDDLTKAREFEDEEYSDQDRQKDIAIVYGRTAVSLGRLYGPAAIVGIVSVAALTGSHVVLSRRNAAITAAYAAIAKGFQEYRSRVVHEFGADKDRELRYNLQERTVVEETDEGPITVKIKDVVPNQASIYSRFFDQMSPNWNRMPHYNQMFLQCQHKWANDLLHTQGHLFLNEVYDMLGIPRSKEGAVVGWVMGKGGDDFVDFGVFDGDRYESMRFINGHTESILLDFNVDGIIWDKI